MALAITGADSEDIHIETPLMEAPWGVISDSDATVPIKMHLRTLENRSWTFLVEGAFLELLEVLSNLTVSDSVTFPEFMEQQGRHDKRFCRAFAGNAGEGGGDNG